MPERFIHRSVGFSPADWAILAIGAAITTYLALGVHDFAIANLGVPYPQTGTVPPWVRCLHFAVRIGAFVWLYRRTAPSFGRFAPVVAAILGGLISAGLLESLRVTIIEWVMIDGSKGLNWVYVLTDQAPAILDHFYEGCVAMVIARSLKRGWGALPLAAIVVAAIFLLYALTPGAKALATSIPAALHAPDPVQLYDIPFPLPVHLVVFATYIEATIAALVIAMLVWPVLPGGAGRRIALFTLLMLFLRGVIVQQFGYVWWLKLPLPTAFLSEGQFFGESLALGLLSGSLWNWVSGRRNAAARAG